MPARAGGVRALRRVQSVDRPRGRTGQRAVCRFCDTDFVGTDGLGGGKFATAGALADAVLGHWGEGSERAVRGAHRRRADVAGRRCTGRRAPCPRLPHCDRKQRHPCRLHPGIDWVCASAPRRGAKSSSAAGDELKLRLAQAGTDVDALERWDFAHFLVQPMDSAEAADNMRAAIAFAWRGPDGV